MANYCSDPLRPARPGRIIAQVQPTRTYHGESLTPDYSAWMPGLGEYDRLQRNHAMGVPVGQYGPPFPSAPRSSSAGVGTGAPAPSSIGNGARGLFPGVSNFDVGNQLAPQPPSPSQGAASWPGNVPQRMPGLAPGSMPNTPSPSAAGPVLPVSPKLPSYLLSKDNLGNGRFNSGSRITVGGDGSKTLLVRDGSGSATFGTPPSQGPDTDNPGDLDARAMHGAAMFPSRPRYTRDQLAKMDAASLAALALWPRGPELQRQWLMNPASLPKRVLTSAASVPPRENNATHAQALAARALRPRFGSGASSSTAPLLMRSGPRSAAELAKLDPAAIAALALQPRAPQMTRQLQQAQRAAQLQSRSGLNAASFTALPDSAFTADPHSYLQPMPLSPDNTPVPNIGSQAPILSVPQKTAVDQPPALGSQDYRTPQASASPMIAKIPGGIAGDPLATNAWKDTSLGADTDWAARGSEAGAGENFTTPSTKRPGILQGYGTASESKTSENILSRFGTTDTSLDTPEQHEAYVPKPKAVSNAYAFLAGHAIDADGAANAFGGPHREGLDNKQNAHIPLGKDKNGKMRYGGFDPKIIIFQNGRPYVQKRGEASPGSYVTGTTLADSYYPKTDTRRYADSLKIPYVVRDAAMVEAGVQIGDLATVYNLQTGQYSHAIVADNGPKETKGEISINESSRLGLSTNPRVGGGTQDQLLIIPYPGSRIEPPKNGSNIIPSPESIQARGDAYFKAIGQRHLQRTLEGTPLNP
jgi:hypothetical protein